jgi:hypothetical protein
MPKWMTMAGGQYNNNHITNVREIFIVNDLVRKLLIVFLIISSYLNLIGSGRQNQDLGEDEYRASNDDDTQRSNNSEDNNNQEYNNNQDYDNTNNFRGISDSNKCFSNYILTFFVIGRGRGGYRGGFRRGRGKKSFCDYLLDRVCFV